MRPFNIEEAKKGKPVVTRKGVPVKIIYWDKKGRYPLVALVGEEENLKGYTLEGNYYPEGESLLDLFMGTEKKEGWINLYESHSSVGRNDDGCIYSTEEEAIEHVYKRARYVKTIKIEWEE